MAFLLYLSSGIFLGWSLGANDAANVFGSAVGSKMLKFRTAAVIGSIFIILGAGISGAGAAGTLDRLGSVNEIAGAFMVALAAAVTVFWMTRLQLPVSTSQAIVGSIIGWNFFSRSLTDMASLRGIVITWIASPVLAAFFSIVMYVAVKWILNRSKIHMLKLDIYTRIAFIVAGAFGSYSLGANNIANVMGVFLTVSPFRPLNLFLVRLSPADQLFILGGIAIAAGVASYSYRVMRTVGSGIIRLSPIAALVVVLSTSMVLFIFASEALEFWLIAHNLPSFPLVPVSSSQAVVGAVLGIGIVQGGRGINFRLVGKIASGWVTTPIMACLLSFISLFFIQNVFNMVVYNPVNYRITPEVAVKLHEENVYRPAIDLLVNVDFDDAVSFSERLKESDMGLEQEVIDRIISFSEVHPMRVNLALLDRELENNWLKSERMKTLKTLEGMEFQYKWQLYDALLAVSPAWRMKSVEPRNRSYNRILTEKLSYLYRTFAVQ